MSAKKKPKSHSPFPILVRSQLQVGNAVRRLRKLKKLSQIELAKKSGLTQATISRIEKGRQRAEIQTLLLILAALNADLAIDDRQVVNATNSLEGLY